MSKIIKFPNKLSKSQRVRNELNEQAHNLDLCYGALEEALRAVNDMEEQVQALQNEYNYKLLELVNEVGIEGINLNDFRFANIGVGAGSREFTLTLEDGETFTFEVKEDENDNE
jgi:hypothetical protein